MIKEISYLGLGTMGSGMASNVLEAGYQLNSARRVKPFQSSCVVALIANLGLLVATASGQQRILPELPQAKSPVKLVAASDPVTGKSEFRFEGNNTPPVIRVPPGSILKVEYKNELAARSKEECVGRPCMNMTNLHFHGLHVSPNAPQDDVLDTMASPGETLNYSVQIPPQQPPGLYWYHTHAHGESYVQDLDGMSGAIVVEGMERYVPELLKMRERIVVLRDLVLPEDPAKRKTVMTSVAMQTSQCGTALEKPERAFTVNGSLRPKIDIAPGERQFWRIVNASPDLYVDLELDSGPFDVVALDGMPLAYHDPAIRTRSMGHVLVPPAGRLEAIDHRSTIGFVRYAALTLFRYRSRRRSKSSNGPGRYNSGAATNSAPAARGRRRPGLRAVFRNSSQTGAGQQTAIRCHLH